MAPTIVAPMRNTNVNILFFGHSIFSDMPQTLVNKQNPKIPANKPPPSPNISPCNFNVHFLLPKINIIEINIGRQQKQVTDVYLHLLTVPFSNRSPPKKLFERFYPMVLFSGFYGIYKNLVLNYSQSRVRLN